MKIVVQKFGGTSLSTKKRRIKCVDRVVELKKVGESPVVVVSAIGRKGDSYATDSLLNLVDVDFSQKEDLDMLMSCGEIISAVIFSNILQKMGFKAKPLSGEMAGIITDNSYGDAQIKYINIKYIKDLLEKDIIPVVAGFQGRSENGFITTLGRGGSDTTAVALAVALNAKRVEIYSDVAGLFTADPNIVKEAKVIDKTEYEELFNMSCHGAKIVNIEAAEIALKSDNITLELKSAFSPEKGTKVLKKVEEGKIDFKTKKFARAVTHIPDIIQISIKLEENIDEDKRRLEIYSSLAEKNISLDMFTVSPGILIFTLNSEYKEKAIEILNKLNVNFRLRENCAKISLVGTRIHGVPGIMAKIANSLYREKIKILQTVDSHSTISCLVNEKDIKRALKVLHKDFHLGNNK